ncbi:MAG: arsenate reductase ArsC [Alphaproteobacteria bacterium]
MRRTNVLFLCTGNSARSILAEAILGSVGKGRFNAWSAGSNPAGKVHPYALDLLESHGFMTTDLRSKSWDEFAGADAPEMDFVFTVCGNAAGEVCPIWSGHPMGAHWGLSDPAAAQGSEADKRAAFENAYRQLENRISMFVHLPLERLEGPELQKKLTRIGQPSTCHHPT